jgi:hypothetical protein
MTQIDVEEEAPVPMNADLTTGTIMHTIVLVLAHQLVDADHLVHHLQDVHHLDPRWEEVEEEEVLVTMMQDLAHLVEEDSDPDPDLDLLSQKQEQQQKQQLLLQQHVADRVVKIGIVEVIEEEGEEGEEVQVQAVADLHVHLLLRLHHHDLPAQKEDHDLVEKRKQTQEKIFRKDSKKRRLVVSKQRESL